MEMWRAVKDFEGSYEVSSHGRIRSLTRTVVDTSGLRTRVFKGKLLKNVCISSGYHLVSLHKGNRRVTRRLVHRIVMETFKPVDGMEFLIVDHRDGNRTGNRLSNLRWTTFGTNNRNTPYTRYLQGLLQAHGVSYICEEKYEG